MVLGVLDAPSQGSPGGSWRTQGLDKGKTTMLYYFRTTNYTLTLLGYLGEGRVRAGGGAFLQWRAAVLTGLC